MFIGFRNTGLEADPDTLKAALYDGEIARPVGSGRPGFKFWLLYLRVWLGQVTYPLWAWIYFIGLGIKGLMHSGAEQMLAYAFHHPPPHNLPPGPMDCQAQNPGLAELGI